MASTSDRQPSQQSPPSTSSPTTDVKRDPSPSPTPSPRSIHFQETSNSVESHRFTPDSNRMTVTRKASIPSTPIPTSSPRNFHFQETERRTTKVTETSITRRAACPLDTHPGAGTEVCNWRGPVRTDLVKQGYQTLAVMCTFVAAVQGQLLQMTYDKTDDKIINAFFFAGLFADIGAAILSASSARWFEMLTPDEAEHVYDWLFELKGEEEPGLRRRGFVIERWLYLGLKSGLYAAFVGLGFLAAGLMLYVWVHTPRIVQVMSTVSCTCLVLLLPPFFLPHDRVQALRYFRLHRFSGRDIARSFGTLY